MLIGATAVLLAGGSLVAAQAAERSSATTAVSYVASAVSDGAVADPVLPAYRPTGAAAAMAFSARLGQAADGTRVSPAVLADQVRRQAAATARAQQVAAAAAKAKAVAQAQARARAVARARAAAAARAAVAVTPAKKAPAPPAKKAPVYSGDITRTPAAMSSSAARAAIPLGAWLASPTARKVVRLESGGSCTEVSGIYHGKWQMTVGLWKGHGGRAFAPVPEQASCGEQDIVAYRIWVERGWSPWSTA